jgi:hypothetical protein
VLLLTAVIREENADSRRQPRRAPAQKIGLLL